MPKPKPMPILHSVRDEDVAEVLDLNHLNVALLAPMDMDRLRSLEAIADRFDVVEVAGRFAGFLVTFAPGAAYDSQNYRWFTDRYEERFYYLDRIVLDDRFRRRGLGSFVYDEIETVAAKHGRLALEVNLVPRNDISMSFHERRGFTEVGRLDGDGKTVCLMTKELT